MCGRTAFLELYYRRERREYRRTGSLKGYQRGGRVASGVSGAVSSAEAAGM